MLGIMTDYTEAEIKEDLKSNIELYAYSGKDTTAQDQSRIKAETDHPKGGIHTELISPCRRCYQS